MRITMLGLPRKLLTRLEHSEARWLAFSTASSQTVLQATEALYQRAEGNGRFTSVIAYDFNGAKRLRIAQLRQHEAQAAMVLANATGHTHLAREEEDQRGSDLSLSTKGQKALTQEHQFVATLHTVLGPQGDPHMRPGPPARHRCRSAGSPVAPS